MPQHTDLFSGDPGTKQIITHSLPLGDNMRGAGACEPVRKTSPVNVCIRTLIPAALEAIIARSPALGVKLWTMSGRSERITWNSRKSERRSEKGAIRLSIGTSITLTPSQALTAAIHSPGEDTATTSWPALTRSVMIPFRD